MIYSSTTLINYFIFNLYQKIDIPLRIFRNNFYLPWAFKIPTVTTIPETAPTKNDPEFTANAHNVAAAPVSVATISSLLFAGAGTTWPGWPGAPGFGTSCAFTGKLQLKNVISKIDKTVPNPKR